MSTYRYVSGRGMRAQTRRFITLEHALAAWPEDRRSIGAAPLILDEGGRVVAEARGATMVARRSPRPFTPCDAQGYSICDESAPCVRCSDAA